MASDRRDIPGLGAWRQAGIAQSRHVGQGIALEALEGMTLFRLHSLEETQRLASVLARAGLALPAVTNQAAGTEPALLCLRPGEWLLSGESGDTRTRVLRLGTELDADRSALLDVADGLAVLRLSGPAAPWLLAKHSALDFIAEGRPAQHCARTRLGGCAVIIHHHPAGESGAFVYDLIFDRSVAAYIWNLLCAAVPHASELAEEFGQ